MPMHRGRPCEQRNEAAFKKAFGLQDPSYRVLRVYTVRLQALSYHVVSLALSQRDCTIGFIAAVRTS